MQIGKTVEYALESREADVIVVNTQQSQTWKLLRNDFGGRVVKLAVACIVLNIPNQSSVMLVVGVKVLLRSSAVRGVVSASGNYYGYSGS